MNRFSICELSTYKWSFLEDVVRYSLHGLKSIGVWKNKLDDFGEANALDLLHEHQMSVSSLHWTGGFTCSNGSSFEDCLNDCHESIRLAARLNADCLIVHPGPLNGHLSKHAMRLAKSGMESLVDFAADYDVRLAMEPMLSAGGSRWSFINDLESCLTLISDYSEQQVGLVLDLYHVGMNEELIDRINSLRNRIALVQLADYDRLIPHEDNRCLLGDGNVPISEWIHLFNQIGYRGKFEVEIHGYDLQSVDYFDRLDSIEMFLNGLDVDLEKPRSVTANRIEISE